MRNDDEHVESATARCRQVDSELDGRQRGQAIMGRHCAGGMSPALATNDRSAVALTIERSNRPLLAASRLAPDKDDFGLRECFSYFKQLTIWGPELHIYLSDRLIAENAAKPGDST